MLANFFKANCDQHRLQTQPFIMGDNLILGIVIFCVLLIVNFMVITKGAGRMAEVGARFALDGLPGRQLAIDADMAAGAITHAEAKERRERELAETTFFGSLDGASKFVKGDAVAGLLITLLNIVMGLIMGIFVHGMEVGRAVETYTILTVGDGLVSQIPAVVISVAAALLLSRGGSTGAADVSFFRQLGRYPAALATVAVLMALFALVPGMPFLPFMMGAVALGASARFVARRPLEEPPPPIAEPLAALQRPLGDVLDFDEIHVEFAPDLVAMVLDPATGLDGRIGNMRSHVAAQFGLILPEIRLTDEPSLAPGTYRIRIQGVTRVTNRLMPGRCLVLLSDQGDAPPGIDVAEPVYGTPARWIDRDKQEAAVLAGLTVVSAPEVLATHLLEVIRDHLARLLSLRGLRRLLDEFVNLSDRARAEAKSRFPLGSRPRFRAFPLPCRRRSCLWRSGPGRAAQGRGRSLLYSLFWWRGQTWRALWRISCAVFWMVMSFWIAKLRNAGVFQRLICCAQFLVAFPARLLWQRINPYQRRGGCFRHGKMPS